MPKGVVAIHGKPALVGGRPLLLHAVETLRAAGVSAALVVGDTEALEAVRPWLIALAPGVECLRLERPGSPADALLAAAGWLDGDDVVLHAGDGMLLRDTGTLRAALADTGGAAATVFFAATGPGCRADAERVSGVHIFSSAIHPALEAVTPPDGEPRSLVAAIDRLAATGHRIRAGVLGSWWTWDGTAEALLEADRAYAHVTDAGAGPRPAAGDGASAAGSPVEPPSGSPRARIRHVGVRVAASAVSA
jgi:dTDP-glucose pyrophosphorylase